VDRPAPRPKSGRIAGQYGPAGVANGCSKAMEVRSACAWAVARRAGVRICVWPAPRSKFTMSVLSRALLPRAAGRHRDVAGASCRARTALAEANAPVRVPCVFEFGPKP
jgi:hypothetical protein